MRQFEDRCRGLEDRLHAAPVLSQDRWQGVEVKGTYHSAVRELTYVNVTVAMGAGACPEELARYVRPNLPWADEHFEERVGGSPLNPGESWKNWPYGKSAGRFVEQGLFNHTYAERLWPKHARMTEGGVLGPGDREGLDVRQGIGGPMGDLSDVVSLLVKDPGTRQAWIPLFFPEDTGVGDGGRKPCTLGYHFLLRNGMLNVWYPLRSCDFYRHFRDDVYLAGRLLLWVIDSCRWRSPDPWSRVSPGVIRMDVASLHAFESDCKRSHHERPDRTGG